MRSMKVKLEDVCERDSSNLRQSDVEGKTGDYPIYGAAGYIGNVDFFHQNKPYVAVVKDGAGIGRTMLLPAKSSVIGTMQYLLPKENVLPEYLFYVVRYMHLEKYISGATIPHIYFRDYKNEEFHLDSLDRQAQIVDVLGRVEKVIKSRKQELTALDDLIKARFVEMFGEPEAGTCIYPTKKLKTILKKISDGVHAKPEYTEEGRPFLSVVNINKGVVDFTDCKYVSEEAYQKMIKSTHPQKGDILYTKVGATYGIPAHVNTDKAFCLYVSVCLIKPDHEKINSRFLALQMAMPCVKHQADARIKGIGVPDLHLNQISEFDIIYPPRSEQEKYVLFVDQVDKAKTVIQKALDGAQLLFDSLMQKYFG